ncbi:MAG: hypothetical protein IPN53_20720 [Comamonadaceae bacterium]|nr:hypothetical protein [Comamonadaceae bacterium]
MTSNLTESEINELAAVWYRKLDVHAPLVDVLPYVSDDGLEMKFPEATLYTLAEFEGWYQKVIRIFFDEVHTIKEVKIIQRGDDSATVHVIVEWQASVWAPPAAKSARIVLDADQTWIVKRSQKTGGAVISTYIVNGLSYHEGSATL